MRTCVHFSQYAPVRSFNLHVIILHLFSSIWKHLSSDFILHDLDFRNANLVAGGSRLHSGDVSLSIKDVICRTVKLSQQLYIFQVRFSFSTRKCGRKLSHICIISDEV